MTSPMPPAPAQALGNQSDPNTFLQLPPIKLSPDASESDSDLCPTPSTSRPKPRPANVKTKKALLDKGKEKDVGQKADKRGGRSAGKQYFTLPPHSHRTPIRIPDSYRNVDKNPIKTEKCIK